MKRVFDMLATFAGYGFVQLEGAPEQIDGAAQHDLFVHQARFLLMIMACSCKRPVLIALDKI